MATCSLLGLVSVHQGNKLQAENGCQDCRAECGEASRQRRSDDDQAPKVLTQRQPRSSLRIHIHIHRAIVLQLQLQLQLHFDMHIIHSFVSFAAPVVRVL